MDKREELAAAGKALGRVKLLWHVVVVSDPNFGTQRFSFDSLSPTHEQALVKYLESRGPQEMDFPILGTVEVAVEPTGTVFPHYAASDLAAVARRR